MYIFFTHFPGYQSSIVPKPASEKLYSFLVVEIKEGRVLQEFFAYATKSRKFTLCPPPPFIMGVTIPLNED